MILNILQGISHGILILRGVCEQPNCIMFWNRVVLEKIDKYLLETVPYYQFCNDCMGSENEITATVAEYNNE